MPKNHPRLVLDTSTIISAFFWKGNESSLLKLIEKARASMFLSKEILDEVEDVINRPKFRKVMLKAGLTPEQVLEKIISMSRIISGPRLNIRLCRDRKDNKFLECAVHARADFIISGDEDLLSLKRYKGIQIARSSAILKKLA